MLSRYAWTQFVVGLRVTNVVDNASVAEADSVAEEITGIGVLEIYKSTNDGQTGGFDEIPLMHSYTW